MSDHDHTENVEWPEGVISVRVGPGANCSSMGSSIQLMWAAAVAGGVIAVVASALIGARESKPAPTTPQKPEEPGNPDEPAPS